MKKLNLKNNLLFLILKRVYNSANPTEFEKLTHKSIAKAFRHTFFVLFICFIVMSVLALPKIISLKSNLENKFSHFDKLTIDITAEMNSPLVFTENQGFNRLMASMNPDYEMKVRFVDAIRERFGGHFERMRDDISAYYR